MIELNCSYAESKKILDLGYDFSKVCWKSLYEYRDQWNLNKTFIRIHVHGAGLSLTLTEDQINYQMEKYGIVDLVTPIIPKAALEACLPDLSYSSYVLGWLGHTLCNLDPGEYVPSLIAIDKQFNSSYEAFIWCQENYPEELKKKFDEVVG
jgi:uncharacterized SAM-dependent methyltransferase